MLRQTRRSCGGGVARPLADPRTLSLALGLGLALALLAGGLLPGGEDLAPRPRLFFRAERVERLRERVKTDERLRSALDHILEVAEHLLLEELVPRGYSEGGSGQHGNFGRPSSQVSHMASVLGLAYRMTGEGLYAEKLRAALLHHGELSRWAGDAGHDPPWHSELNTARFCFGYAVGYDSLHDFLTEGDRETIRRSMVRLGIRPTLDDWVFSERRIHALDSMGHNWWSVCVAMAGLAALSLVGDEPEATDWVERVSEAFPEWFAYSGNVLQQKSRNFDRRGAFYESVGYADYALSEYLLFRLAWRDVFPSRRPPEIPLLGLAGDFFVQTSYPTSERMLAVDFGDSSLTASGARTMRLLLANGFEGTGWRWYLARTDPGLGDPVALACVEGPLEDGPPGGLPTSAWYPDIGWTVLRSSWRDDATLFALKSGFTWNHAHPDAGSFLLFHAGKPLIIDSGSCSYGRREYSSYYRQSRAHNVILLDGEAQSPEDCAQGDRGVKTPGSIPRTLDAAGLKYLLADATGPTAWRFARNYRHVLWLGSVILIVDDVRGHAPGQFEWLLHYDGRVERREDSLLLSAGADCCAVVSSLFPKGMRIVERTGLRDHDPDTEVTYLAFLPEAGLKETKFMTAIAPLPPQGPDQPGGSRGDAPRPTMERLEGEEAIGVRVHHDGSVTDVYLNLRADGRKMHRNSSNTIAGWETDAYLFAITRPEAPWGADGASGAARDRGAAGAAEAASAVEPGVDSATRYFVACGSYLRRDGTVVLGSLSKVDAIFTAGAPDMEVALAGQPVINVTLRSPSGPRSLLVNGRPMEAPWDEARGAVRISMPER